MGFDSQVRIPYNLGLPHTRLFYFNALFCDIGEDFNSPCIACQETYQVSMMACRGLLVKNRLIIALLP